MFADIYDDPLEFVCPTCGSEYLHQTTVAIWGRKAGEDSQDMVHVFDHTNGVLPANHPIIKAALEAGNPSLRRDGLTIALHGECGHVSALSIFQVKGRTQMRLLPAAGKSIYVEPGE